MDCEAAETESVDKREAHAENAEIDSESGHAKTSSELRTQTAESARLNTCIQDYIKRIWLATERVKDVINETEYVRLHVRIQKAMKCSFDKSEAVTLAQNWFKNIVLSSPQQRCCFNTFTKNMLKFVANFLRRESDARTRCHFFGLLLSRITVGVTGSLIESMWEVEPCEELGDAAILRAATPTTLPQNSKTIMNWDTGYIGMMSVSKDMQRNYAFSAAVSGSCVAARTKYNKGIISVIRSLESFPINEVFTAYMLC